jgi:putative transposase
MRDCLDGEGTLVNRKRVQRLMRTMNLTAVYPKKRTSQPGIGHRIYPYLLRGLHIDRPRQVYAADITYIPMAKGFVYLVAVIDWYSRKVLSYRISNTLDVGFCVEALKEALERYGPPEIFNTDQGAQFTAIAFTNVLKESGVKISMDGKGRWLDNVYVERLWRSLKYEEVYLKAYESVREAKRSIGKYLHEFNSIRRCQSLGRKTPDEVFFNSRPKQLAA